MTEVRDPKFNKWSAIGVGLSLLGIALLLYFGNR